MRPVRVEISAVILGLRETGDGAVAAVLTTGEPGLPTVAFDPDEHPTLERALRGWVAESAGVELGHVEQLYTFGDGARRAGEAADAPHLVSIGYLALARPAEPAGPGMIWSPLRAFFPWEDRRAGAALVEAVVAPALANWIARGGPARAERARVCFGLDAAPWRDELVLERYELLYEARLVPEAWRDRREDPAPRLPRLGEGAPLDHRRILATGLGRLRGKLKYRPVLFELTPEVFTLYDLQRAAEAVAGVALHKQNFRRMVDRSGLVEPTGGVSTRRGGRPAAEYRYAPEATWERRAASVRFGGARRG